MVKRDFGTAVSARLGDFNGQAAQVESSPGITTDCSDLRSDRI
jgi:hypothetical protein